MSRLAQAITERDTGERKALQTKLKTVEITETFTPANYAIDYSIGRMYQVEARLGAKIYIDESKIKHRSDISVAVNDVRKQVIEEVFGEFRPLLIEMRVALYDADTTRARQILSQLEYQMFVEGL